MITGSSELIAPARAIGRTPRHGRITGLISSTLFSSLLHLPRPGFVAAHALVTSAFVKAYVTLTRTDPAPGRSSKRRVPLRLCPGISRPPTTGR